MTILTALRRTFSTTSVFRAIAFSLLIVSAVGTAANAAKWFIDSKLGDVAPGEVVKVDAPKPVQLIFEFRRDGKAVPAARKQVQPLIVDAIKTRSVFSDVLDGPTTDGAILNVVMENVVDKEELEKVKKKAFGAGLSFGLGSGVVATDHYVFRFELIPAIGKAPIVATVDHAIHMRFGNTNAVIPGVEAKNMMEALRGVVGQSVAKGLNSLATDPGFAATSAVTPAAK